MKIHGSGVDPSVCGWERDFLSDKQQRVIINNCIYNWLRCNSGMPTILFLIYTNELPDCMQHAEMVLYAADVKIFKRTNYRLDCVLLQRDLDSITNWCTLWQLKLNISKRTFVRFGLIDKPATEYYFSVTGIQNVLSTKDLSIIFDSKMAFSKHCHVLANKGFSRLYSLLRCFHSRAHEL